MNKLIYVALSAILIVAVVAGYLYGFFQGQLSGKSRLADSKVLFESNFTRNVTDESLSKRLGIAVTSAVQTNKVYIDSTCKASVPVLKMFPDERVEFLNLAATSTVKLTFGSTTVMIPAKGSKNLAISDIMPQYVPPRGFQTRTYSCNDGRKPAGFIVLYPD